MRAFMIAWLLLSRAPAAAHESSSPNFRNLTLDSVTSQPAAKIASTPARKRAPARRAHPIPVPEDPDLRPLAASLAAAAALGLLLAWRLRRRRDGGLSLAAHELKSPLSALESYLALMERDGRSGVADARAWLDDIGRMRATAAHLRRVVADVSQMSLLEDGRLKPERVEFDLAAEARRSADSFAALAAEAGAALEVSDGAVAAHGDPARSRQIVDSLVGNALKHAPRGGRVAVRARADGDTALVEVSDDGAGVPPAHLGRLFGRFARLGSPLRGDPGSGLGLYIGRALARAQGGDLVYRPGPQERGSVFTLRLPRGEGA